MKRPVITLLSDFGLADHYVAVMKGVILGICPDACLVDISHDITPFAIPEAAYTLAQAWRCFPIGTVHLAVCDPGVGSSRRAIVVEAAGHRFVAPDNGLLSMVLDAVRTAKIREISAIPYFRQPVSQTFHGRDIFAPVAAHLGNGLAASKLGKTISDPVRGDFAKPTQISTTHWTGTVLKIDRFGNIISNLDWDSFHAISECPFTIKLARRKVTHFYSNYSAAPEGQLFAMRGSSGYMEVSLNQSNAARKLSVGPGSTVELFCEEPGSTILIPSTGRQPK
jgi:hypothetical protein